MSNPTAEERAREIVGENKWAYDSMRNSLQGEIINAIHEAENAAYTCGVAEGLERAAKVANKYADGTGASIYDEIRALAGEGKK